MADRAVDVAVVGAGPAGAWAARKLARAGARVLVFDPSHPREKPCGGGLTGRAVALIVDELGALPAPAVSVGTARFERALALPSEPARVGAGDAVTMPLPDHGASAASALVVASRAALDRGLLDAAVHAGATLIAERVVAVDEAGHGMAIQTRRQTYRANLVLGADGANSLVRRQIARPFSRAQLSVGAGYFARGVSSREMVIRWTVSPPGYLWSFPRTDHLAVGSCAQADEIAGSASLRQQACGWLAAGALTSGPASVEPYSWPIPSLRPRDFDGLRVAGNRWMLLGDAAGLVDPLTREGIFYALLSGELAADAIAGGARDPATLYRASLADGILPELRRAATLKTVFFSAEFSRLVVMALNESEAIRQVMVDLVGGRQPYRGLRRRLLATLQIGLAWRLVHEGRWRWSREAE